MKLEINYQEETGKTIKMWRLNNMLMNNQWVINKIKEEIKKYLETNENKYNTSKFGGVQQNYSKREDHNNAGLLQEIRKIPNKQFNFIPKGKRKRIKEAQCQ